MKIMSDRWRRLMKVRVEMAIAKRKLLQDRFRIDNGYSWDYVIVFQVRKSKQTLLTDVQKKNSLKFMLERLASAGLQTKLFYSAQYDEVYCKIRAPLKRLQTEAHRIKYKLLAEPVCLSNILSLGNTKGPIEKHWAPVSIPEKSQETIIPPYDYMYLTYNDEDPDISMIYKRLDNGTIFRGVDRLKLIAEVISARVYNGGCHLDLYRLIKNQSILAFYPLHDVVELCKLEDKWLTFLQLPWQQNTDACRDYFGEKIGLYFAWLGHYTSWLLFAGITGFLAWIGVAVYGNDPNAPDIPFFAVYISIWSTLLLEFWKRKERRYQMMWGTESFETDESERPEFQGVKVPSPIDGSEMLYFPRSSYYSRVLVSVLTITAFICIVIGVIAGIFASRIIMSRSQDTQLAAASGIIASLLNAVQIQVLNMIYGKVAVWLTDYENHRTNTNYEDSLVAKTFVFQFVNSFASLFYIAFVKPFIAPYDTCLVSCLKELQTNLGTIFLTRLATGSLTSILVPYINSKLAERTQSKGVKLSDLSDVEMQFLQQEYHVVLGTFTDYAGLVMQFGYATMFISAYPLATVLAFVSNYVQLRVDAWKLCQFYRRPEPRGAADIGTWYSILEIISVLAVLVNAGLIAFTGTFVSTLSWAARTWVFVGMSGGVLIVKFVVSLVIPDVPREVEIQLERKGYIVSKVVHCVPDDNDESLVKGVRVVNEYTIRITDDDPL